MSLPRITAAEPRSAAHPDDEKPAPAPVKVMPTDPDPEPKKPAPPPAKDDKAKK